MELAHIILNTITFPFQPFEFESKIIKTMAILIIMQMHAPVSQPAEAKAKQPTNSTDTIAKHPIIHPPPTMYLTTGTGKLNQIKLNEMKLSNTQKHVQTHTVV